MASQPTANGRNAVTPQRLDDALPSRVSHHAHIVTPAYQSLTNPSHTGAAPAVMPSQHHVIGDGGGGC